MLRFIFIIFQKEFRRRQESEIEAQQETATSKKRNKRILLIVLLGPIAAQIALLWAANEVGENNGGLFILAVGFVLGNLLLLIGGPVYLRHLNRSNRTDATGRTQAVKQTSSEIDPKKLHLLDLSGNK